MAIEYALVSPKNADLEHPSSEVIMMFPQADMDILTLDEAKVYWANFMVTKLPIKTQNNLYRQGWEVRPVETDKD